MDESSLPQDSPAGSFLRIDRPPPGRLAHLHQRSIAVRFQVHGEDRLVLGQGLWEDDPQLGALLHIQFSERADEGELLVLEREWTGEVESGEIEGCDFLIHLF